MFRHTAQYMHWPFGQVVQCDTGLDRCASEARKGAHATDGAAKKIHKNPAARGPLPRVPAAGPLSGRQGWLQYLPTYTTQTTLHTAKLSLRDICVVAEYLMILRITSRPYTGVQRLQLLVHSCTEHICYCPCLLHPLDALFYPRGYPLHVLA